MLQPTGSPEALESLPDPNAYSAFGAASASLRPTHYATLEDALIDMQAQLQENDRILPYVMEHTLDRYLSGSASLDLPLGAEDGHALYSSPPAVAVGSQELGQATTLDQLSTRLSSPSAPSCSSDAGHGQSMASPTTSYTESRASSPSYIDSRAPSPSYIDSRASSPSEEDEPSSSSSDDADDYKPGPSASLKRKRGKAARRSAPKRARVHPKAGRSRARTPLQVQGAATTDDNDNEEEEDEENADYRMTHNIGWAHPPKWGNDNIPKMPAGSIFKYLKETYGLKGDVVCQYNGCGKTVNATSTLKKHLERESHIRLRKQCKKCNWETRADMWASRAASHPCEDSQ